MLVIIEQTPSKISVMCSSQLLELYTFMVSFHMPVYSALIFGTISLAGGICPL